MSANLMSLASSGGKFLKLFGDRKMMKTMPTARDYVQDGLIAMWDGIENAGWGVHDANAKVWRSLVGNVNFDFKKISTVKPASYVWGDDCLSIEQIYALSASLVAPSFLDAVINFKGVGSEYNSNRVQVFNTGSGSHYGCISPYLDTDGRWSLLRLYFGDKKRTDITSSIGAKIRVYHNGTDVRIGNDVIRYSDCPTSMGYGYAYTGDVCRIGNWTSDIERGWCVNTDLHCLRIYDHDLTEDEFQHNYEIDKARFNLPTPTI